MVPMANTTKCGHPKGIVGMLKAMSGKKTNNCIQFSTRHMCKKTVSPLGCHYPQGKKLSGQSGDYVTPSKTVSCNTPSAITEQQEQCNDTNIQNNATSTTASTTPKTCKRKTKGTRVQKAKAIKFYYLALHKRILIVKSTYELWRGRQNQTGFGHVTAASLANM
eukprot:13576243-Ditylum_brightwellii.AAC.1